MKDMRGSGRMRNGLRDLIAQLPHGVRMAEIGCYAGESTALFLESGKVAHLTAVDKWDAPDVEARFDESVGPWIASGAALKVKARSVAAAKHVADGSLDFVYIDADHRYASVRADIAAWLPKIRAGGIMAGHDYAYRSHAVKRYGVIRAVHEAFVCPDKLFDDSSWLVFLSERE